MARQWQGKDKVSGGLLRMRERKRRKQQGKAGEFWTDGTRWVSASHADNNFIRRKEKRHLQHVIADNCAELQIGVLCLGAVKTH